MHKDGNLDVLPVESEAKEGYYSYEDFKRGRRIFRDTRPKKDSVEARLDSMRDIDPSLTQNL